MSINIKTNSWVEIRQNYKEFDGEYNKHGDSQVLHKYKKKPTKAQVHRYMYTHLLSCTHQVVQYHNRVNLWLILSFS